MGLRNLLPILLVAISATVVRGGTYWDWWGCPAVMVKDDFDITKYRGTWYEIAHYPALFQPDDARCTTHVYSAHEKGDNYMNVLNELLLPDGTVVSVQGETWIPDPTAEPGKFRAKFSGFTLADGEYWALDTDYNGFSLVHSCTSYFFFHTQGDWILSRQRTLDDLTLNEMYQKLQAQGVSAEPFVYTDQTNCQ